ncbi:MAG: response regulator [Deltaproteobacteria bacterium]|nr:response regulator [Deltaproteobacteria bacterium]
MATGPECARRDARLAVATANLGVRPPADARVAVAVLDVSLRSWLVAVLEAARWLTVEVPDADTLVTMAHEGRVDLILVDVEPPAGAGLALCRRLKEGAATHLVPVVAVSVGGHHAERLAAYAAGADHYLTRPFDPDELTTRCGALLRSRGLVRTLEERRRGLRLRADFAGFLVHDLRSPLTAALANLELLRTTIGGDPAGDNAAALALETEHEVRRIAAMLRDLLDVDRCERGRLVVARATFGLRELLARLQLDLRYECAAAGVPLALEGALDAEVTADRALVERVLANLVGNALRHSPRGAAVVVDVAPAGETVRVSVVNRGPAVPPAARERIFEPYVQLDAKEAARGAGLGLAFCRLVIEAHGGSIHVEEPAGGGAAFVFTLPRGGAGRRPPGG